MLGWWWARLHIYRHFVTCSLILSLSSEDRDMAGLQTYIFSLEDCIDFSIDVIFLWELWAEQVVIWPCVKQNASSGFYGFQMAQQQPLISSCCHMRADPTFIQATIFESDVLFKVITGYVGGVGRTWMGCLNSALMVPPTVVIQSCIYISCYSIVDVLMVSMCMWICFAVTHGHQLILGPCVDTKASPSLPST